MTDDNARNEFDNSRPLNIELWSDRAEVNAAVDAIFAECAAVSGIKRQHERMKTCLKVVLLNLFNIYAADSTCYVRYSRRNVTLLKSHNILNLSNEQIVKAVDNLIKLGYVSNKTWRWSPNNKIQRQARMRAFDTLIERMQAFEVLPLMAATHIDANIIKLKDSDKKRLNTPDTEDTRRMQQEMVVINKLLSESFLNLYMSDRQLYKLKKRMRTGKIPESDFCLDDEDEGEDEVPRGSVNLTHKSLYRIFNNGSLIEGGRMYGGW
jgi:hypothetical protein